MHNAPQSIRPFRPIAGKGSQLLVALAGRVVQRNGAAGASDKDNQLMRERPPVRAALCGAGHGWATESAELSTENMRRCLNFRAEARERRSEDRSRLIAPRYGGRQIPLLSSPSAATTALIFGVLLLPANAQFWGDSWGGRQQPQQRQQPYNPFGGPRYPRQRERAREPKRGPGHAARRVDHLDHSNWPLVHGYLVQVDTAVIPHLQQAHLRAVLASGSAFS